MQSWQNRCVILPLVCRERADNFTTIACDMFAQDHFFRITVRRCAVIIIIIIFDARSPKIKIQLRRSIPSNQCRLWRKKKYKNEAFAFTYRNVSVLNIYDIYRPSVSVKMAISVTWLLTLNDGRTAPYEIIWWRIFRWYFIRFNRRNEQEEMPEERKWTGIKCSKLIFNYSIVLRRAWIILGDRPIANNGISALSFIKFRKLFMSLLINR